MPLSRGTAVHGSTRPRIACRPPGFAALIGETAAATAAAKCAIAQLGYTDERVTGPQLPVTAEGRERIARQVRKVNELTEALAG